MRSRGPKMSASPRSVPFMAAKTHSAAPASPPVLPPRALGRATLARQLLLRRSPMSAKDAVGHLVGLQAQNTKPPYHQLFARLEGFDPAELSGLMESREVVRIVTLRSTIHTHTADDALTLRPLVKLGPRPGAEDVPQRARRCGSRPARRARQGACRGPAPYPEGDPRGAARRVAGRRPAGPDRGSPLRPAPGPGHPARTVGPQRPGRADHRGALARPWRSRRPHPTRPCCATSERSAPPP